MTLDKLVEQNQVLIKKVDQLIERQKNMEEKLNNLENELHVSQVFSTEKDFIEV
jgi:hypothetical protein